MKERPILFNAEMVRAVLDGKTQTRRIAKTNNDLLDGSWADSFVLHPGNRKWLLGLCPFGSAGERLYVRETWAAPADSDGRKPSTIPITTPLIYRASRDKGEFTGVWRPSIHMPRWASRITLEITEVRIERLNDISEADAMAEGVSELAGQVGEPGAWWTANSEAGAALHGRTPTDAFRKLWESINGAGSWAANPWVWVISFRTLDNSQ